MSRSSSFSISPIIIAKWKPSKSTAHISPPSAVSKSNMAFPFSNISGFKGSLWFTPLFLFTALINDLVRNDFPSKSPCPSSKCKNLIALNRALKAHHPFFTTVCSQVRNMRISTPQLCFDVSTHGDICRLLQNMVRISQFTKYTVWVSPASEVRRNLTESSTSERFATASKRFCASKISRCLTNGAPAIDPPHLWSMMPG